MRMTRFTDNALRCLIYLGSSERSLCTVGEISRQMSLSEDHLLKVVKRLSQVGLVRTVRGRKGGLLLARTPESINIAEVVRATEDNLAIVPCFDGGVAECPIAEVCVLSGALDEALGAFFASLAKYTLADLIAPRFRLREVLAAAPSRAALAIAS